MINRAALILKAREPFLQWIMATDTDENMQDLTLEALNSDCTVYLISDQDAEDPEDWVDSNIETLFSSQLDAWFVDQEVWPDDLSKQTFDEWFNYECHTLIIDTVSSIPMVDDVFENPDGEPN